jgi:DNA-binding NarL/FixJ family response regulator
MIKVLLADDHPIVRNVLRLLIHKVDDMKVVAQASDGQEAVSMAAVHCPHVAVMDISMPNMNGMEATRQILARSPETRVLMVSAHNSPHYIKRSLEAGALGYVLKDEVVEELVTAIRSIYKGKRYLSKQVGRLAELYKEITIIFFTFVILAEFFS